MDANATSAMHVIKKEDKQSVLRAFISQDLEARRKIGSASVENNDYYVVARSPLSPVARALAELADEMAALGITVHAVFSTPADCATRASTAKDQGSEASVNRQIHDTRLLDAHEMLLLGSGAAWVGDCMRRDPATSDAFERYSANCPFTAASVRSSFEQFWNGARPLTLSWLSELGQGATPPVAMDHDVLASSSLNPLTEPALSVPATRH
ncbi:MAG: hypothetical protein K0U34_03575 [Alphaproteobacteria bacterium]|nr:hypothetical protein [Alphaproteobacteria bacterium]